MQYARTLDMLARHGWPRASLFPHGGNQMSLAIAAGFGLGGAESYPGVFGDFGGFADDARIENGAITLSDRPGIGFEGQARAVQDHARIGGCVMAKAKSRKVDAKAKTAGDDALVGKRLQFDRATWAAIDLMRREQMKDLQELTEEAFRDLLKKYGRTATARGVQGGGGASVARPREAGPGQSNGLSRLRGRAISSRNKRQRPRHRFQRLAFGVGAPSPRNEPRRDHQHGAQEIADEHARARAGIDQRAEQPGADDAADPGADRVEERDGERAHLDGKVSLTVR